MSNEVTDDQIIRAAYQYLSTWDQDTIRFARAVLALTSAPAERECGNSDCGWEGTTAC